jgi:hypothetical protein
MPRIPADYAARRPSSVDVSELPYLRAEQDRQRAPSPREVPHTRSQSDELRMHVLRQNFLAAVERTRMQLAQAKGKPVRPYGWV